MLALNVPRGILLFGLAVALGAAPAQAPTHLIVSRAELQRWEDVNGATKLMLLGGGETAWAAYFAGRESVYRELGGIIDRAAAPAEPGEAEEAR